MSVSDHEKLEANLHVQPFSDSVAGIPIKKRHFLLCQSASPPSQIPSPPQVDHDLPEKKPFSSDRDEPSSESGIHPDQVTSMTGKGGSRLPTGESIRSDCDLALRCEILPELNNQGNSAGQETGEAKEIILDNKCSLRDIGCTHLLSAGKNSPEPLTNGFVTGNIAPNEGTLVRQELGQQDLESKSGDANKEDSAQLSLNRSNWDLNTTMDEWEDSLNASTMNLGIGGHDKFDLRGMHANRTEKGMIQNLYRESTGTDATLSKCTFQNSGGHLRVPNLAMSADKNNNLETCLDLQLKSSFMSSGKFDSLKDLSFLSLSVKPIQTVSSQKLCDGITVKPGPNNLSQNDKRKVEMASLISGLKHVKSEPCERQEPSKTLDLTFLKPAINRVVKSEPLDDQSQVHVMSLEGRIAPAEIKYHSLTLQAVDMKQSGGTQGRKASDLASVSLVSDVKQSDGTQDMKQSGGDMPISTVFPKDGMEIVNQVTGLTSYSQISQGNDTNVVREASEIDSLHSVLVPGSLVSDGKKINADGIAQMDCSDSYNSSEVTSIYEVPTKLHGNTDTELAGNNVDKVQDTFTKNLEKTSDTGCGTDNSVPSGAVGTLRKLCGSEDDYEDGEVRDPNLISGVEGSSKESEKKKQIKRSASMSLLDALIAKRSHVDVKEQEIDKSEHLNDQGTIQSGRSETDMPSSSAVAAVTDDFGKRRPSRTLRKTTRDHAKKVSGVKEGTKPVSDLTKEPISKVKEDDAGRQKVNAGGSDLLDKASVSSKKESSEIDNGAKGSNDRSSSRRIVYLNAPNRLTLGKMKSNLSRSISSHIERDRSADKSFRRDRSHSRSSRDENSNERPRRTESERTQGQHFGKRGADFMRGRRSDDRFNGLDGERTSDAGRLLDEVNDSNAPHRFPRSVNASELGSGRLVRKHTDELQDLSRMPCRRRSPVGRGQMPMIRRSIRDVSPSRGVGRGIPDFILRGHEEPDSMMDPSMLVHARSRYERERQDIITRRERRSFSPVQQRGPMELHHIGSRSFPRSQQRSPHQWSPPRRSPDAFVGQPRELVRCRSPPIIRLNGVRSPQQRQCFPEDAIVRRRDSPPFITRLPNDGVDISPPREHDFPRSVRGDDRNMRRFNLINPREMQEEGYLGPPMHLGQIHRFSVDDEFVGTRRSNERQGPVRPVRRHILAADSGGDGFRLQVENGPPQPLRFRPEANEGFPEGGVPRDFDGRFRNRLGGRLRGIEEQEDNYIHQGEQGWDSAGFSDARLKRRRF